jgi:hypothetical protein
MTGETTTFTGVSAATFTDSGMITAGSDTITLWAAASSVGSTGLISGSLTITEEPDTLTIASTESTVTEELYELHTIHIGDTLEPPGLAESLLIIFARRTTRTKDIDALAGDFEERFKRDCAGMSRRRAVRRYWAHVVYTIGPQMCQALRRLGWLGLIAAFLRRWF